MSIITKKDLSIFRGTYLECKAQPTEDMRIYLAWDTQEIYIGNSYGEKVLYGVSKSLFRRIDEKFVILDNSIADKVDNHIRDNIDLLIQDELERIKEELFAEVENEVIVKVNEKVVTLSDNISTNSAKIQNIEASLTGLASNLSKHIEDFDTSEEAFETYKSELNQTLSDLKTEDGKIDGKIDKKEKELLAAIAKVDGRVDNTNSEMGKMENRLVAKSTYESDKKDIEDDIKTERERIDAINGKIFDENNTNKIDKNAENISDLLGRTSTLETNYSTINTKITGSDGLETKVTSQGSLITELTGRVTTLEENSGSGDNGNCLLYLTGDTLSDDAIANFVCLKTFITAERPVIVIFCISDSNSSYSARYRYKGGMLYFFNNISLTAISGGGSGGTVEKDVITASITAFNVSGWSFEKQEIHNKTYTFGSGAVTFTVSDANDIITSLALKYNSSNISYLNTEGSCSSTSEFSFSASTPGTHSVTLSASAKTDDEYTDYQLSGGSQSESITFYQPSFIYLNETEVYRGNGLPSSKTYTTINPNDILSFWVPTSKTYSKYWLTKTDYGYNSFTESTTGTKTINGVENVSYNVYKIKFAASASNALVGIE